MRALADLILPPRGLDGSGPVQSPGLPVDAWVLAYRHELDEHGVDPDRLLEETHERSESARTTSLNLFDCFLERVARPRERA